MGPSGLLTAASIAPLESAEKSDQPPRCGRKQARRKKRTGGPFAGLAARGI